MIIDFHRKFKKSYKKLDKNMKTKVDLAIHKFRDDPFDKTLKNHALSKKMEGKRAFSVSGNVRIVFEEYDDYVLVIMLDVGTHSQVYGM
jgi:addiction module RelE/StbE family toxin